MRRVDNDGYRFPRSTIPYSIYAVTIPLSLCKLSLPVLYAGWPVDKRKKDLNLKDTISTTCIFRVIVFD
jgi:hypothetical protein